MPETAVQKTLSRNQYLSKDKSVNFKKHFAEQKKLKESGLEGIEVRKTNKQLGKDDFLKLLITQLTHQDPTAPVKDQAFIAQMAQFSSLEQMKNVSSTLKTMSEKQSQNLVGKFIVGKDHLNGEQVSGVAQAMFYDKGGDAFFKVGGRVVRVNDITLIGNPDSFKKEFGGTGANTANTKVSKEPLQLLKKQKDEEKVADTKEKKQASFASQMTQDVKGNTKIEKESMIQKKAHQAYDKNLHGSKNN